MTQDQFCDGIRLLGGPARAAETLGINQRAIERTMSGKEGLGKPLARRLVEAVDTHRRACAIWVALFDQADIDAA